MIKANIKDMQIYAPPLEGRDPKKNLLLDFNEKTLPVGEKIQQAMIDYIRCGRLQMYPSYGNIVERIAQYTKVDSSQVMITNGSDQGIELVFRAVCSQADEVIIPEPSFAMYRQCAQIENTDIISPFYQRGEGYPLRDVLDAITDRTRVIVVSNPNNPSGTLASASEIEAILKAAPNAAVLVDECYYEYAGTSVVDLVEQYHNLIVLRTFSKTWGIPSLRFGYMVSASENIGEFLKVRGPYDINQLAVVAVGAALDDLTDVKSYVDEVMNSSKPLLEAFFDRESIVYWKSAANYLWAFFDDPDRVAKALEGTGILVRPKKDAYGKVGLRITLGTKAQTLRLIEALEEALV